MTKAMVLAGGRNSRMGELAPKALLPVSGRPNVQRVIEGLHPFDLSTFYVNSHLGLTLNIARNADEAKRMFEKIKRDKSGMMLK